jgi:hypothetical protein
MPDPGRKTGELMTHREMTMNILLYGVVMCFGLITAVVGLPMIVLSLVRLATNERVRGPRFLEFCVCSYPNKLPPD